MIIIFEYMLALGIAFIVSAITVYFRDLEQIMGVVMMAWIYVTPIMYNMDYVPEQYRKLVVLNPMTPIVEVYHQILYYRIIPTTNYLLLAFIESIIVLILGFVIFAKIIINGRNINALKLNQYPDINTAKKTIIKLKSILTKALVTYEIGITSLGK